MPGEALGWLATDDLMVGIIFILSHGNANLHRPVIVLDSRRDFGFRTPAEDFGAFPIEIDDLSTRTDRDLVVRMRLGGDLYLDGIAMPKGRIVVASSGVDRLFSGQFITANREVDTVAQPPGFECRSKGRGATGLQFI